jgi:hypothetical protein
MVFITPFILRVFVNFVANLKLLVSRFFLFFFALENLPVKIFLKIFYGRRYCFTSSMLFSISNLHLKENKYTLMVSGDSCTPNSSPTKFQL